MKYFVNIPEYRQKIIQMYPWDLFVNYYGRLEDNISIQAFCSNRYVTF